MEQNELTEGWTSFWIYDNICQGLEVELDTQQHQMELDTGAAVSLMSEQTYQTMFPDIPLQ